MKKLSGLEKIAYALNLLAALLLLLSYSLPYLPPKQYGLLSVLSLGVPLLIILNILFFLFWLLKVKKHLLLSLAVLLIGFNYVTSLYKFTASKPASEVSDLSIMSYNVRLFNLFDWIEKENIEQEIRSFILKDNPDVICFQEYHKNDSFLLKGYHKYESLSKGKVRSGQAIFSKFPILNSGSISFPNTSNDAIFIDIKVKEEVIRVYNVHLQSSKINTDVDALKKETSENLFKRVGSTFKLQQSQADLFLNHVKQSPYKVVISGDFNNTVYSFVYHYIKGDFVDSFQEAGNGFGRTYDFKFFPVRIDFILVDKSFKVDSFTSYNEKFSDHYPIKTSISLH